MMNYNKSNKYQSLFVTPKGGNYIFRNKMSMLYKLESLYKVIKIFQCEKKTDSPLYFKNYKNKCFKRPIKYEFWFLKIDFCGIYN